MFTSVAAMALVAALPVQTPDSLEDPNGVSLPPLGCLQMFPPHAWCVAQQEAAEAFLGRCRRELVRPEWTGDQRAGWQALRAAAGQSCALWRALAEAQDEANPISEGERRSHLELLLLYLREDFHAGRMPPPVPKGAPGD
jgi:hypothetical protein